jgi:hypothetical protein
MKAVCHIVVMLNCGLNLLEQHTKEITRCFFGGKLTKRTKEFEKRCQIIYFSPKIRAKKILFTWTKPIMIWQK